MYIILIQSEPSISYWILYPKRRKFTFSFIFFDYSRIKQIWEEERDENLLYGTLIIDRLFCMGVKTEFAIDSAIRCSVMQSYRLEL